MSVVFPESADPTSWVTKDGRVHNISKMEDRHIHKALKHLYSLSESDVRQGLHRMVNDLEKEHGGPTVFSMRLHKVASFGSLREARVSYTPQLPHLDAEAERRGIKGWRYIMADKEVYRSLGTVLEGAAKIVKTYKSLGHNPNVPIKPEIEGIIQAVELLEKAGFRFESCPR